MVTLGTDVLKQQFGEITTEILLQSQNSRAIRHRNSDSVIGYAFVQFKEGISAFPAVHAEIVAGSNIGETLRRRCVPFSRDDVCVFEYEMPSKLKKFFLTEEDSCFVKQVEVFVGEERAHYASVIEVYSPPVRFEGAYDKIGSSERIKKLLDKQFS